MLHALLYVCMVVSLCLDVIDIILWIRNSHFIVVAVYAVSRRGRPVIQIGSYRFNKRTPNTGMKSQWQCIKRNTGCRAALTTLEDVFLKVNNKHNHD